MEVQIASAVRQLCQPVGSGLLYGVVPSKILNIHIHGGSAFLPQLADSYLSNEFSTEVLKLMQQRCFVHALSLFTQPYSFGAFWY